jgi:hypothetical protein
MGLDEKLPLGMCFAPALFITLCAKYRLLFFVPRINVNFFTSLLTIVFILGMMRQNAAATICRRVKCCKVYGEAGSFE